MNERNQAFDATKGFLIILVIMGHVLLGSISENLGREVIYFFHMPIFLAITGYFTKRTLINKSIAEILLKYKYRMILPFIYAFAFYTTLALIRIHISEGLEIKHFTYRILYPFYHLWYVPAVIIFAFYTKSLERIGCKTSALIVSCFFFLTIIFEGLEPNISDSIWYESLGDKRFYYFFTYYFCGYYLSSRKLSLNKDIVAFLFLVGITLYGYSTNDLLVGLGKTVANISIIIILFSLLEYSNYKSSFLEKIGRVSLPIYLWHVAPLLILKNLPISESMYYSVSTIFFILFIYLFVAYEGKSTLTNKYIYGVSPDLAASTKRDNRS